MATLAWNTVRHVEAWYGIMGIGAVCHTLNPRLFERELEYIINHAEVKRGVWLSRLLTFFSWVAS